MIFNVTRWSSKGGSRGGINPSEVTTIADDVLTGKLFINSSGVYTQGSMINRGNVNAQIDGLSTPSYTVPSGYHSGSGTVSLTSDIEDFFYQRIKEIEYL